MPNVLYRSRVSRGMRWLVDLLVLNRLRAVASQHVRARGRKMAVFANDYIGSSIFVYGLYEQEELETLFGFLSPLAATFAAATALDVGANIGNHSLYFAERFKSVVAFEPNPATFSLLQFNLSGVENAEARNRALGATRGSINMAEDALNQGASKISDAGAISIEMTTLDESLAGDVELCFMKLDVEGFEAEVLRGGLQVVRRCQPIVVLEQNLEEFRDGTTQAIELLRQENYSFCWQETGLEKMSRLGRRFANVADVVNGRELRIVGGSSVPVRTHSMLIAVPPRFQEVLSL
jgi:FkbM family methyltransferase